MKTIVRSFGIVTMLLVVSSNLMAQKSNMTEVIIKTSVVCDMCKEKIEKNLIFEKGVKEVRVDMQKKEIYVRFRSDKNTVDSIKTALTKLGYRADEIPADEKAFSKLPDCCKKEGCGKD